MQIRCGESGEVLRSSLFNHPQGMPESLLLSPEDTRADARGLRTWDPAHSSPADIQLQENLAPPGVVTTEATLTDPELVRKAFSLNPHPARPTESEPAF